MVWNKIAEYFPLRFSGARRIRTIAMIIALMGLIMLTSGCVSDQEPTEPAVTVPVTTTAEPTERPTTEASEETTEVTTEPTTVPTTEPATEATAEATTEPATKETTEPETEPTTEPATEPTEANGRDYVVNTNTGKFHYPSCSSADRIKESNRWDYFGTREDLIDMGYSPCGRCHP